MKKSRKKGGIIFKATFTEDTAAGVECFVNYGYDPSWDFVKNGPLTCVAQSVEQEEAEEKQAEAAAPEPKKKANKRRKKRGQEPAPENANEVQAQVSANDKDDVD